MDQFRSIWLSLANGVWMKYPSIEDIIRPLYFNPFQTYFIRYSKPGWPNKQCILLPCSSSSNVPKRKRKYLCVLNRTNSAEGRRMAIYFFCAFCIKQCKSCVFLEKVIQNRWLKTQLNKTNCKYLLRYLLVLESNYLLCLINNSYIFNLCWLAS